MKLQKIILLTLCVALFALSGCEGKAERKAKYMEKGKAYLEEQNYEKARLEFKNVVQIDPKYAEAYYFLGQVNEGDKEWRKAYSSYSKAVELAPENLEARTRLGRIYVMANEIDKAQEQMEAILQQDPAHAEGRLLKVLVLSKKDEDDAAILEAQKIVNEDKHNIEAISILAALYGKKGDADKAIALLEQGVADNPDVVSIRVMLGRNYALNQKNDKVEQQLKEIIRIEPDVGTHRTALAMFYSQMGQPDRVEQVLRESIDRDPDDETRYKALADFLVSQDRNDEAEKELLAAIERKPDANKLRFALARFYEKVDKEKAGQTYRKIIELNGVNPDALTARNALAAMLIAQDKTGEAKALFEEVLKENPRDNGALLLKGRLAMSQGDAVTAINAFRSIMKDQPESVQVATMLANAHLLNKEPELAKEVLQRVADLNEKDVKARLMLAQLMAKSGDNDAALGEVSKALDVDPENLEALRYQTEILVQKKDMAGVEKTLAQIKESHPDSSYGYLQMGNLMQGRKEYDKAIVEYEAALKRSTRLLPALASMVRIYVAQGRHEAAIARLNEIAKETSEPAVVHELKGEVYLALKEPVKARQEAREAINAKPDWGIPYSTLASTYLLEKNSGEAVKAYEQGLQALPDDVDLMTRLAGLSEKLGDFNRAIGLYEKVIEASPDNLLASNNLAALLVEHRKDPESLARAKELVAKFESSQHPGFMDTVAWVSYQAGDIDKSVQLLEKINQMAPNVPIFQYHLGMAYYKKGDNVNAKELLGKAVANGSEFSGREQAEKTLKNIQ